MSKKSVAYCPLCKGDAFLFALIGRKKYYQCHNCQGVFLDSRNHLPVNQERNRYLQHNNNISDPGYRNFAQPLVSLIENDFPPNSTGLDYGCGNGPVVASMLSEKNYPIELYDPFFKPHAEQLNKQYDYIVCCEVIEHFYHPEKEFHRLASLLLPQGKLYCKTHLLSEEIRGNFENWWYKNDPTHVFFYPWKTLTYIATYFDFLSVKMKDGVIVFSS